MKHPSGQQFGLFMLYAIALLLIGANAANRHAPGDPIQSSSFQLVDGEGQVRGRWAWHEEPRSAELAMNDGQGRMRSSLRVDDAGEAEMMILSPRGRAVIDVRAAAEGNDRAINLDRTSGKGGLHLGLSEERGPSIMFEDENGSNRMRLGFAADNRVAIETFDVKERPRAVLGAKEDGTSCLEFFNEDEKIALEVGHSDNDASHLSLYREDGNAGAFLYRDRDDSAGLSLFDSKDRARHELFIDEEGKPGQVISGDDGKALFVAPPENPPRQDE